MQCCPNCGVNETLGSDALSACMTCGEMAVAGFSFSLLPVLAAVAAVAITGFVLRGLRIRKAAAKLATA